MFFDEKLPVELQRAVGAYAVTDARHGLVSNRPDESNDLLALSTDAYEPFCLPYFLHTPPFDTKEIIVPYQRIVKRFS
jgi:hypothetical protein